MDTNFSNNFSSAMKHISYSVGILVNKFVVFGVLKILNRTTVTVNSERYGHMITDFFLSSIEEYNLENMWFQQDGVISHTTRENMDLLQVTFPGRIIFSSWRHQLAKNVFMQINFQLLRT